ncbi:MAG: hypothetical protein ACR2NA_11360 [Solirubrobacterales bacterium]
MAVSATALTPPIMPAARHLDLVVLALALPVFVLAELPIVGYVVAAVVWLVQKAMQMFFSKRAREATDYRWVMGYETGGAMARGWMAAIAILIAGIVGGDDVGLAAVVMIVILFTVYFTGKVIQRVFERTSEVAPK